MAGLMSAGGDGDCSAKYYWSYPSYNNEHSVNYTLTIPKDSKIKSLVMILTPSSDKWVAPVVTSGTLSGPYVIYMNGAASGGWTNTVNQGCAYVLNDIKLPCSITFKTSNWDWRWGIQVFSIS